MVHKPVNGRQRQDRVSRTLSMCTPVPSTAPFGLRIKPSLKAALGDLAQADHRTLASYVELALEAHVEARPKEDKRP